MPTAGAGGQWDWHVLLGATRGIAGAAGATGGMAGYVAKACGGTAGTV